MLSEATDEQGGPEGREAAGHQAPLPLQAAPPRKQAQTAAEARRCPCTWPPAGLVELGGAGRSRPGRGAESWGPGSSGLGLWADHAPWHPRGLPPTIHIHPGPVSTAFLTNQVFADGIQLRRGHAGVGWPRAHDGCPHKKAQQRRGCGRWAQTGHTPRPSRDYRQPQKLEATQGRTPASESRSGRGHSIRVTSGPRHKVKREGGWLRDPAPWALGHSVLLRETPPKWSQECAAGGLSGVKGHTVTRERAGGWVPLPRTEGPGICRSRSHTAPSAWRLWLAQPSSENPGLHHGHGNGHPAASQLKRDAYDRGRAEQSGRGRELGQTS